MTLLVAAILLLQDADTLWRDLGHEDAGVAYETVWRSADKKLAEGLVARLVPRVDPARVREWIAALASDQPSVRDQASSALADLGLTAEELLQSESHGAREKSVKAHLDSVLAVIRKPNLDAPAVLQRVRAIRLLKKAGAEEALKSIAAGARTRFERVWTQRLLSGAKTETDSPQGMRAADELELRYWGAVEIPAYDKAIDYLASEDSGGRRRAGLYVAALFRQLRADEENRVAPWKDNPYWGVPATNTARELRGAMGRAFGARAEGDEALDAAQWLLADEPVASIQAAGIEVLARIKSPRVPEIIRPVLEKPHPNALFLEGAIKLTVDRGFKTLHPAILRLCAHHRKSIREKAREAAAALDLKPVPEFVPEKSFTAEIEAQLKAIASMPAAEIPAGAAWCEFHVKLPSDGWTEPMDARISGWKLGETAEEVRVLTWFGEEKRWPRKAVEISGRKLVDEIARFSKARSKEDGTDELSTGGGVRRQTEPSWLTVPEALVAAWAFAKGDLATAAAVLLPRIDETEDDRWIVLAARDLLGRVAHEEMLDAFIWRRNYGEAIGLARHLSKPVFDGYPYQARAKELAAQLEKRSEDFKSFSLPEPAAWAKLKPTLSREEQVRFLADRLRLLNGNCGDFLGLDQFQSGLPGRQAPFDRKEERINPYYELKAMPLTPSDLEIIAEYAADPRFMPMYEYWREFSPQRTLFRTAYVAAVLANDAAVRRLVDLEDVLDPPAEALPSFKEAVLKWARAHRGMARPEIALEAIATCRKWWEVSKAVEACIEMKEPRALRALEARLKDFPKDADLAAKLFFQMDAPESAGQARLWLKHDNEDVRYWAARILMKHGDRAKLEGYTELKQSLMTLLGTEKFLQAFDDLWAIGTVEAREFACSLLKRKDYKGWEGDKALRTAFLAGRPEASQYIEAHLHDPTVIYLIGDGFDDRSPDKVVTAGDCLANSLFGWKTAENPFDERAPAVQRAAKRKEIGEWIRKQAAMIREGNKSEIKSE